MAPKHDGCEPLAAQEKAEGLTFVIVSDRECELQVKVRHAQAVGYLVIVYSDDNLTQSAAFKVPVLQVTRREGQMLADYYRIHSKEHPIDLRVTF